MAAALLFISLLFLLPSCGGGGGGEASTHIGKETAYQTRCGVIVNGSVKNTPSLQDIIAVHLEPVTSDTVIVTRIEGENAGTSQLVKLHGVSAGNSFSNGPGAQRIRALIGGDTAALVLPSPGSSCAIETAGAGQGVVGQIFTSAGQNVTETLLAEGLLSTANDVCNSERITDCYSQIEAEAISPKRITDFLWKPVSESNHNLAVLVDPHGVSVVVTGAISQTLINTGPSNGRGTTARSPNASGGRFGRNVLVEFFDETGKRVLLNNGERSIIIPNGGDRVRLFY